MQILMVAFLAQAVVITVIVCILKKVLDNMLIDLTISHFGYSHPDRDLPEGVVVISHRKLKDRTRELITKAAKRHAIDPSQIHYQIDRNILGGLVIRTGHTRIDGSLKDRLRQALPGLFKKST